LLNRGEVVRRRRGEQGEEEETRAGEEQVKSIRQSRDSEYDVIEKGM
jgi:hypothetical protein